jgi:hypothetical protein
LFLLNVGLVAVAVEAVVEMALQQVGLVALLVVVGLEQDNYF